MQLASTNVRFDPQEHQAFNCCSNGLTQPTVKEERNDKIDAG